MTMKKSITYLAALALTFGAVSCDESWNPPTSDQGELSLNSLGIEVSDAENIVRSRADVPSTDNFLVEIYDAQGALAGNWTYKSMPEVVTLGVGTGYRVDVKSHAIAKAEWEKPYYAGSATFDIEKSKITSIGVVTCRFSSLRVSVIFTDRLRALLGDDVEVTAVLNEDQTDGRLVFTPAETRSAYFDVAEGESSLALNFHGTVNGYVENFSRVYTDIAAGQHRQVTLDVRENGSDIPEESGGLNPTEGIYVTTDVTDEYVGGNAGVEEDVMDPSDRPGKEDPIDPPGPGPEEPDKDKPDFTSDYLDLKGVNMLSEFGEGKKPASLKILAPKGVKTLHVFIDSATLDDDMLGGVGLATKFYLDSGKADNADATDLSGALSGMGFPVGDKVVDQTEIPFDITGFMEILGIVGAGELHKFIITVTDNDGNVETATLQLQA